MYLHFQDFSPFAFKLTALGVPHVGKVIKVHATEIDPRQLFGKRSLMVLRIPDEPFSNSDIYNFGDRGIYQGSDLEIFFADNQFTERGKRTARALFRFATQESTQFVQRAMAATFNGKPVIEHPLNDIHRLLHGAKHGVEHTMHIDVFYPPSLTCLRQIVNYDDPALIISLTERRDYERMAKSGSKER